MTSVYYYEEEEQSPTDTSEDSVEVAVKSVQRNKRKSHEPKRFRLKKLGSSGWSEDDEEEGLEACRRQVNSNESPLKRKHGQSHNTASALAPKKRFKREAMLDMDREAAEREAALETRLTSSTSPTPFRPWALDEAVTTSPASSPPMHPPSLQLLPQYLPYLISGLGRYIPAPVQEEPLALVVPKEEACSVDDQCVKQENLSSPDDKFPFDPAVKSELESAASRLQNTHRQQPRKQQTNYKSMTKDRRVEANARERQRVHTITAAFDSLQAAIPVEEENAKLSKLSVIKIATAYIMALSRMAGHDYTEDQSAPSVSSVISHCQEVIHNEARVKKRGTSN